MVPMSGGATESEDLRGGQASSSRSEGTKEVDAEKRPYLEGVEARLQ